MNFTIYGMNLHNSAEGAQWLKDRSINDHPGNFDIALVSEAQSRRVRRRLNSCRNHNYFTGPAGQSENDAGREVGILLKGTFPNRGGGSYFLTPFFPPSPRVGKERWGQVRVTLLGGVKTAVINIHPTWPGDTNQGSLLELQQAAVRWANHQIQMFQDIGHEVVFGSDLNMKKTWAGSEQLKSVLDRNQLHGLWTGLDVLVVSSGLKVLREDIIHVPDKVTNHPINKLVVTPR